MNRGTLEISKYKTKVLIAESQADQAVGLMYRNAPVPFMAFPYKQASVQKFWMQNTKVPLDIVFCRDNRITQIRYGEPYSTQLIGDDTLSDLIVEFPKGTCEELGITIGDHISLTKEDRI